MKIAEFFMVLFAICSLVIGVRYNDIHGYTWQSIFLISFGVITIILITEKASEYIQLAKDKGYYKSKKEKREEKR